MLIQSLLLVFLVSACTEFEEEDSCADFVEYICTCHSKNPKYNCMELKEIYLEADFEQQEQCALALDDLMYQDAQNKVQCTASNVEQATPEGGKMKEKSNAKKGRK